MALMRSHDSCITESYMFCEPWKLLTRVIIHSFQLKKLITSVQTERVSFAEVFSTQIWGNTKVWNLRNVQKLFRM